MDPSRLQTVKVSRSSHVAFRIRNFSLHAHSPFRYPGGKTWFTKYANIWLSLQPDRNLTLVEPFAGGASVSLSALKHELVGEVKLADTDPFVASFWQTVAAGNGPALADRIVAFKPTKRNVLSVITASPTRRLDIAFKTIVQNRFCFGGILAHGAGLPSKGERERGLTQRWYPVTIANRILLIHGFRDKLSFVEGSGLNLIQAVRRRRRVVCFIDPPYLQGGRNAGHRIYNETKLCIYKLISSLRHFEPKFLLTYHQSNSVALDAIGAGFDLSLVPMKTSHHLNQSEMVITNDPLWELVATWTNK